MNKKFILIVAAAAVLIVGFFWYTGKGNSSNITGSSAQPSNHVKGDGGKKVTLIEYGDYQCPACGAYEPIVQQVFEKYKADITFQFRNFPLDSIHQNARAAARTAEAANKQGKFWEMHDRLYETQQDWQSLPNPTTTFETYATMIGLDLNKYRTDIASAEVNAIINADIVQGQKIKANSTPTFVLEGAKIEANPRSLEDFYKLIDDAIAKKNPGSSAAGSTVPANSGQ